MFDLFKVLYQLVYDLLKPLYSVVFDFLKLQYKLVFGSLKLLCKLLQVPVSVSVKSFKFGLGSILIIRLKH